MSEPSQRIRLTNRFERLLDRSIMRPQVIHDHNVTSLERRAEDALRVSAEDFAIGSPLDHQQRIQPATAQGTDQGNILTIINWRAASTAVRALPMEMFAPA